MINEENVSRKLVVKLLDCYLFRTHDTHIPGAVEFAIGLFMNPGSLRQRLFAEDIIKSAINRVIRNPFLYWQVPSMHNFLSVLIKSLGAYGNYTDSEWVDVERALRAIIKAEDIQFIPLLRNTLEAFKDRRLKPSNWTDDEVQFEHSLRLSYLAGRLNFLERKRKEQKPDIIKAFGQFIGIPRETIIPSLHYPDKCKTGAPSAEITIELNMRTAMGGKHDLLMAGLSETSVEFFPEGFFALLPADSGSRDYFSAAKEYPFNGLTCKFKAYPTKGTNRFSLNLKSKGGKRSQAVTGYVAVE